MTIGHEITRYCFNSREKSDFERKGAVESKRSRTFLGPRLASRLNSKDKICVSSFCPARREIQREGDTRQTFSSEDSSNSFCFTHECIK